MEEEYCHALQYDGMQTAQAGKETFPDPPGTYLCRARVRKKDMDSNRGVPQGYLILHENFYEKKTVPLF